MTQYYVTHPFMHRYTRYYFELRSLYEKLLEHENISREFPLKPLALWQVRKQASVWSS